MHSYETAFLSLQTALTKTEQKVFMFLCQMIYNCICRKLKINKVSYELYKIAYLVTE